jgi:hypothetical protein
MIDLFEETVRYIERAQRELDLHCVANTTRDLGAIWVSSLRWVFDA